MINFRKILNSTGEFVPYYEKENDFKRVAFLHLFASFVFSPIFCYLVYDTDVPKVYLYIGIANLIGFPVYSLICYLVNVLRNKLIYIVIIHYFIVTFFAFQQLLGSGFDVFSLYCFYALYAVLLFVSQRLYPAILYNVFVIGLILYGFQVVDHTSISKGGIFGMILIIAMCSILVLFSRQRMINSVEDYSKYLRKIVNNPGIGYLLFKVKNGEFDLVDSNEEVLKYFGCGQQSLTQCFLEQIDEDEEEKIKKLKLGSEFRLIKKKKVGINEYTLDLTISILELKNGFYWLVRLTDVTNEEKEKEELEKREKKYRNLYYRNQAGVFTTDLESNLLDYNQAFYDMFEGYFQKGTKLFREDIRKEWEEILDLIKNRDNLKNFQTHFSLSNGNTKWFMFNWYLDKENSLIEGTVIDLTEVQKASLAVRQSEEKYRLIYEESNDAILLLEDDKIIDVNRRGIQLFGFAKNAIIGNRLFDFSMEKTEESEKEFDSFLLRLKNSKNAKFNWKFVGKLYTIEAEVALVEMILGEKITYQCIIHDLTELNETMRVLDKSRKSFKSVLDNTPEGIIIISDDEVLYTNMEVHRLLDKEEIDISNIFVESDQKEFSNTFIDHLQTKKIRQKQLHINRQGASILTDVTFVTANFEEKEATMVILKDISIQHQLSKEMLRAELAEETNKKLASEIKERIKAEKQLQEQFLRSNAIFDSSSNTLLLTLDTQLNFSSFNTHCKNYFFYLAEKQMSTGDNFDLFFKEILQKSGLRVFKSLLKKVLKGESRQIEVSIKPKKKEIWLEIFLNPIFNAEGAVNEISLVAHDITEKKKSEKEIVESLKEKEVLLKEIHHRVKNNLQVISSILNLQSSFVKDKRTLEILEESRNRIRSMAIIHENLYQTTNFSSINFSAYLENLSHNLVASYSVGLGKIELVTELEKVELVLDQAIPCGLMVNELVTNSLKYAFPDGNDGQIKISLKEAKNKVLLKIGDNGVGFKDGFHPLESETLGLQLVSTLVEQLGGDIQINSSKGINYFITFDKAKL